MIQTICPATTAPSGQAPALPGMTAGSDGEAADFGALLDGLAAQLIPGVGADILPDGMAGQVTPPLPEGEGAATTGKILPLDLPLVQLISAEAKPEIPEAQLPVETPVPAQLPLAALAAPGAADDLVPPQPEPEGADDPDALAAPPQAPDAPMATAAPIVVAVAPAALQVQTAEPAPPAQQSQGSADRAAVPAADLPAPQLAAQGERAVAASPVHARGKPADLATPASNLAPGPAETVRMDLALQAPSPAIQSGPVQPPSPPPQVRPHEFAALIDRLATAREGVATHTVSLTVAHQDFGPVRLHFRPDELGLSVSMASADPDFARIAASAPPPVLPVQASEPASTTSNQRGESAAQGSAQGQGSAQSRGGSPDRRDEPRQSQAQHRRADPDNPGQRSGIFA